ncbi:MAG: YbjN domain-containing protein [Pseudomonadota bacterium]
MVLALTLFGARFPIASAAAQTIDAVTAETLETILEEAGLSPEMKTDATTNSPVAIGQVGEFSFTVRTLDCSGRPQRCTTLMFFANFELGRRITGGDFVAINNFNESQVFGRAYVLRSSGEKGEVGVDYVIELDGGVSRDHLAGNIERWGDIVSAFITSITTSPAGA